MNSDDDKYFSFIIYNKRGRSYWSIIYLLFLFFFVLTVDQSLEEILQVIYFLQSSINLQPEEIINTN